MVVIIDGDGRDDDDTFYHFMIGCCLAHLFCHTLPDL